MDELIQKKRTAEISATIIGRYFSAELETRNITNHPLWDGYGHLYGYSLLVLQEVVSVNPR
jgi:hypothetical protein